jgi:hypothetical protein
MKLSDSFILKKFYTYSYNPSYKKIDGVYNAGCPVCKEGKSLGKKKRLFFYPKTQSFYCFNCSRSWSALYWIAEVSNSSLEEIKQEALSDSDSEEILIKKENITSYKRKNLELPYDSINLSDLVQLSYYKSNKTIQDCLSYIKERRLDTAINKCSSYFISLRDFTHKNRLCIPFYVEKKIEFYQTRCLDGSDPKYLSKSGGEKPIFNINNIDSDFEYIFLTEGPIDSMFIKNGVGIAGLNLTDLQKKQLSKYPFHKKIWILDNPKLDATAKEKMKQLLLKGEAVFRWNVGCEYKDLNEWCVKEEINGIDYNIIVNSTIN